MLNCLEGEVGDRCAYVGEDKTGERGRHSTYCTLEVYTVCFAYGLEV